MLDDIREVDRELRAMRGAVLNAMHALREAPLESHELYTARTEIQRADCQGDEVARMVRKLERRELIMAGRSPAGVPDRTTRLTPCYGPFRFIAPEGDAYHWSCRGCGATVVEKFSERVPDWHFVTSGTEPTVI